MPLNRAAFLASMAVRATPSRIALTMALAARLEAQVCVRQSKSILIIESDIIQM